MRRVASRTGTGGAALPPGLGVGAPAAETGPAGKAAGAGAGAADAGPVEVGMLYQREEPRLLRFFRRRTADADAAQDLVQETFTRMLAQGPAPALANPGGYLTRVAQNLLRDRARGARRRHAGDHMLVDEEKLAGPDQIHLLEVRDMLDRIERAMLELPERDREVFMAHRLEGLTYGEIAIRAGLTLKQVEKAIARAMEALDAALGQD